MLTNKYAEGYSGRRYYGESDFLTQSPATGARQRPRPARHLEPRNR
ncbi:MAG: hypothetical protein ACO2Z4_00690 [Ilumatobacteraceae bacterium]